MSSGISTRLGGGHGGVERGEESKTYPVPHCSTLVRFSWSRLLIHATSSCLQKRVRTPGSVCFQTSERCDLP